MFISIIWGWDSDSCAPSACWTCSTGC
jgi:hypothetical protein